MNKIMANFTIYNYVCPKCGRTGTVIDNPYPVCDCCGYENVITKEGSEFKYNLKKVMNEKPELNEDQASDIVGENLRKEYTYNSPVFSRAANAKRIEYEKNERVGTQPHHTTQSLPHCPTCNSTNVKKISAGAKAVSVGLFGIFSQKVKRQFHCNNCGYEW